MGSPMSTLWYSLLSCDDPMSVRVFKVSLSSFSPSLLLISHLSVKSISSILPNASFVLIFIFSEFRILHTVEVDWAFLLIKIFLSNILLTSVDFPALVSPAILYWIWIMYNRLTIYSIFIAVWLSLIIWGCCFPLDMAYLYIFCMAYYEEFRSSDVDWVEFLKLITSRKCYLTFL